MATIYFDMDGTLAGLFFVKDFSKKLSAGDMSPYTEARPLYSAEEMAETISALKTKGFSIGVISYADAENLFQITAYNIKNYIILKENNHGRINGNFGRTQTRR